MKKTGALKKATDMQIALISNLFQGMSKKDAAISAGYSKKTASTTVYQMIRKQHFRDMMRDYALQHNLMSLSDIHRIEDDAIKHVGKLKDTDPEKFVTEFAKIRQTLKERKQIAGLLQQDNAPAAPTIRVDNIQQLMVQLSTPSNQDQEQEQVIDIAQE